MIRTLCIAMGCSLAFAATLVAQQYTISTIAGGGTLPSSVPALSVRVPVSGAVALSSAGDLYFSSNNTVMKIDASGVLTRVAGTGQYGVSSDGGPATGSALAWPAGLAVDGSGNLYISENAAHRIRKVSPQGIISTLAGTGSPGYSGDGGLATKAQFNWPTGLAMDSSGNLFIADGSNYVVRRVSPDGVISTAATGFDAANALTADAAGNLYVADYRVSEDDCGDTIYSGRVVKVAPGGATSILLANGAGEPPLARPQGIAVDAAGNLYVADPYNATLVKISPAGATSRIDASFTGGPAGVAIDSSGALYAADPTYGRIVRISPLGDVVNLMGGSRPGNDWGDAGKATDAGLNTPFGVAVDKAGNLYIADYANSRVRKVATDGTISTVAGNGTYGHSGDGGPATKAELETPAGLAVDASGNLYIADSMDNRIRKVSIDGTISTVAGRGDQNPPLGDGGMATNAALAGPLGVAVDASGNLYIADTAFFLVRKVSTMGIITTIAGRNYYDPDGANDIGDPTGIAVDAAGNVYVASFNLIRKIAQDGTVSTIAGNQTGSVASGDGGPAVNASLQGPIAVALDAVGSIYISGGSLSGYPGLGSGYVREIAPNGIINTIAGNGTVGYSGDGGAATAASFSAAAGGIAVDAAGKVYVADVFNNVIRVLRPQ